MQELPTGTRRAEFALQTPNHALGYICQAPSEVNKHREIKEDTI